MINKFINLLQILLFNRDYMILLTLQQQLLQSNKEDYYLVLEEVAANWLVQYRLDVLFLKPNLQPLERNCKHCYIKILNLRYPVFKIKQNSNLFYYRNISTNKTCKLSCMYSMISNKIFYRPGLTHQNSKGGNSY